MELYETRFSRKYQIIALMNYKRKLVKNERLHHTRNSGKAKNNTYACCKHTP